MEEEFQSLKLANETLIPGKSSKTIQKEPSFDKDSQSEFSSIKKKPRKPEELTIAQENRIENGDFTDRKLDRSRTKSKTDSEL